MKAINEIADSLKGIQFLDIPQYIEDLLLALQIPDSTVKRSIENAQRQSFLKPIHIYKRAVFMYDENISCKADFDSV